MIIAWAGPAGEIAAAASGPGVVGRRNNYCACYYVRPVPVDMPMIRVDSEAARCRWQQTVHHVPIMMTLSGQPETPPPSGPSSSLSRRRLHYLGGRRAVGSGSQCHDSDSEGATTTT
jgi:hypothetical protein